MNFVTAAEVEGFLNIEGIATKFTSANQNATALSNVLASADAVIKSYLTERHRECMDIVTGLILTKSAMQGQTEFILPPAVLDVVTDQSYVWVNPVGTYDDRCHSDSAAFTVVGDKVTLADSLSDGDVVVMDVFHTGKNPPVILKKYALDIAVNDIVLRKPALVNDPVLRDMFLRNYEAAERALTRISKGQSRIDEWDKLPRVLGHQTVSREGPGRIIVAW